MKIREFTKEDVPTLRNIWNEVVLEGNAFPQVFCLHDDKEALDFFSSQTMTCVAIEEENILGLYILHPNNIGRCGHIANASFAVSSIARGKHIGEQLVKDCLAQAKKHDFKVMQFNAVVDSNTHALNLYKRLGFQDLGIVPNGFLNKENVYEDIHIMIHTLKD